MHGEWFNIVEIEINNHCNRRCTYCPNSLIAKKQPEYMRENEFIHILMELKKINFNGRLSYHFYNEPLLHQELEIFVEKANTILPKAKQIIFTNGDFLDDNRYEKLINSGVYHFFVTSHDLKTFVKRKHQNVVFLSDLVMTNRGGLLEKLKIKKTLERPCLAPTEMLIITINGDIVLCYEDFHKTNIMGNIFLQPIEDIWFSTSFTKIRSLLSQGKRDQASSICKKCSNINHLKAQSLSELTVLGQHK